MPGDGAHFFGAGDAVAGKFAFPTADVGDPLCFAQAAIGAFKRRLRLFGRGDIAGDFNDADHLAIRIPDRGGG